MAQHDEIYYPAPAVVPSSQAATVEPEPFLHKIQSLRILRANQRYGAAKGALLSGGIAYVALFSIFAALTIAWTVFMAILGNNEELRTAVIESINDAMPGILKTEDNPSGLVSPDSLMLDTALNPASIIAVAVLAWTALSVMHSLKVSLRAMFGIARLPENFLLTKARDALAFIGLALGVLATAALTTVAGTLGSTVLEWLGIEGPIAGWSLRIGSFAIAFAVDWIIIMGLFRYVAGARPPRKDLMLGAAIGALGTSVIRFLGTTAIGSVADNPMLAPFAAIATLLLWVNLVARIVLLSAAFTANPEPPYVVTVPESIHADDSPNFVTLSVPETTNWNHEPFTGVVVPDMTNAPDFKEYKADSVPEARTKQERKRLAKIRKTQRKLSELKMNYRIDWERANRD